MNSSHLDTESFESLLRKSKDELGKLHEECMRKNFFSPLTRKKRNLIAQLNYLATELSETQRQHEDTTDINLTFAAQEFSHLASSLKDINKKNESQFKSAINEMNQIIESINQKRAATTHINLLEYGRNTSNYLSYLGSLTQVFFIIGFAFKTTLQKAIDVAGGIFYPITAVFNTLSKLFQLISSVIKIVDPKQQAMNDAYRDENREKAETLLRTSIAFKSLSVILNALAFIAFIGLISNPIGWGFIAAATLIDWMDEGIGKVREAELAYENQKKKWDEDSHTSEAIKIQLGICHENLIKAKNEERWGRVNVVGMILFACSPIPVVGQTLMIIGLAAFSIAVARNIYTGLKPRIDNYLHPKKVEEETTPTEIEMTPFQGKNLSTTILSRKLNKANSREKSVKTEIIELESVVKISNNSKPLYNNPNSKLTIQEERSGKNEQEVSKKYPS